MKTFDLAFVGWVMATTAFFYVMFFLKTLLMDSLSPGSSFAWLVVGLKALMCVIACFEMLEFVSLVFFLFFLLAMYTLVCRGRE